MISNLIEMAKYVDTKQKKSSSGNQPSKPLKESSSKVKWVSEAKNYLSRKPEMLSFCNYFIERFFVRPEFAIQQENGQYYVARNYTNKNIDYKIAPEIILLALFGKITIAAYTTSLNNTCKFLAIDFDCPEIKTKKVTQEQGLKLLQPLVTTVCQRLKRIKLEPVVEFSGYKGYHVYIFFNQPVSSEHGYRVLKNVISGLSRVPEIFPKQPTIKSKGYGNLIKLPFMVHHSSNQRSCLVDTEFRPLKQQYSALIDVPINNTQNLENAYHQIEYERQQYLLAHPQTISEPSIKIDPNIDPFVIQITGPGERNRKQVYFVLRCLKKGLSHTQTKAEGMRWLSMNRDNFTSPMETAERELEHCIEYLWENNLKQQVNFE